MNKIHYSQFKKSDLILRDFLAIDRTLLANERTFLSYIRTSLALIVASVGIIKFFHDTSAYWVGTLLLITALLFFFIGLSRYRKFNALYKNIKIS